MDPLPRMIRSFPGCAFMLSISRGSSSRSKREFSHVASFILREKTTLVMFADRGLIFLAEIGEIPLEL
jgi:hypothetical protein